MAVVSACSEATPTPNHEETRAHRETETDTITSGITINFESDSMTEDTEETIVFTSAQWEEVNQEEELN